MKAAHVPLLHIAGIAGLIIDGDWVESKDQDTDGDVRLLQLADIGVGDFLDRSSRFMTSSKANQLKCTYLKKGDILVARMPDPIGRACQFPGSSQPCVTVVDVCVLRPDNDVADPKYVTHILNSRGVKNQLDRYVKGATRQRISRKNLEQIPIPLPPLPEQRRIAAILDQADALRSKRREALAQLDSLTQSIFIEMFGDPVRNPKRWPRVKLGMVGNLDRGVSKHRPRNAPELLGGPYPLIQTGDVANSEGYIRTYTSTYSEIGLRQSKLWPVGTLCITIAANIAKTGILTFDACFPDSVVGFTVKEKGTTEYIRVWLSFLQKTLEDSAPESAQKNINLAILRDLDVPLPPIELQVKFGEAIQTQACLREAYRSAQRELDILYASLQHRAFRGEL